MRTFQFRGIKFSREEQGKSIRARNASKAARLIEKDISWGVSTFAAYTGKEQMKS